MQRFHKRNLTWLLFIALGFLLLYGLTTTGVINNYYRITLITIMLNIIYALGLNLILGVSGQFSLGHAGFIALGAYSTAIIMRKMPHAPYQGLALGILVGVSLAIVVALIVGIPTLRLKGDYLAIATLGISEIIRVLINNLRSLTNGPAGISGIPIITTWPLVYFALVFVTILILNFVFSSSGRATRAIEQNEIAAEAMGVQVTKYKVGAFVLGAATAAIGGALQATFLGLVVPGDFSFNRSIDILIIVVFGGIGSFTGTFISAIFIGIINLVLQDYGQLRMVIYAVALILVMILRPQGLLGTNELRLGEWFDKMFKRHDGHEMEGIK